MSGTTGTTIDRRQRNKDRTRHALALAAVRLFAAQGFAETSIEQIADEAEVSPRTFFRYFESKDDVLVPLDIPMAPVALIVDRPAAMGDLEAVCAAFVETAPEFDGIREQLQVLRRALATSPSLRGRNFDQRRLAEDAIADALAARHGGEVDADTALAATVAFVVVRRSVDAWLDGPAKAPLAPILEAQFAKLYELTPKPRRRRSGPRSSTGARTDEAR